MAGILFSTPLNCSTTEPKAQFSSSLSNYILLFCRFGNKWSCCNFSCRRLLLPSQIPEQPNAQYGQPSHHGVVSHLAVPRRFPTTVAVSTPRAQLKSPLPSDTNPVKPSHRAALPQAKSDPVLNCSKPKPASLYSLYSLLNSHKFKSPIN